jgi:ribosomal protein L44E
MSTSKDLTKAIYSNYRAALRAQPHTVSSRAGDRKQKALQITADRYHTPISKVKEIVRTLEEQNKISHDHDPNYIRKMEREAAADVAAQRFMAEQAKVTGNSDLDPICTECGASEEAAIVRIRVNEIHETVTGEVVFTMMCFKDWFYTASVEWTGRNAESV